MRAEMPDKVIRSATEFASSRSIRVETSEAARVYAPSLLRLSDLYQLHDVCYRLEWKVVE